MRAGVRRWRRSSRSSLGAVSSSALSWLIVWVRALTALRRVTRRMRMASTMPSRVFGTRVAGAGERGLGGGVGVDGVGLAERGAQLPVRSVDLDDVDASFAETAQ